LVVVPEVVAPVEPLVPVLLLVEDDGVDEDDEGAVVVELPEAPMPDVLELDDEGVDDEPVVVDGVETDPLAVPAVEPMPEAVPEVEPVELHAARAATQRVVNAIFNILNS
jgi:hypothetical protein